VHPTRPVTVDHRLSFVNVAAITRSMLRDQIREVLLERILEGVYVPGERVKETVIAQELGVSQAPVREALRELEILGMVVSEPYRGARVRGITARELAEIYPIRAAIEEVAGRAAAKALGGDVSPLEAEVDAMLAAADDGDVHRLLVHDVRFHHLIVEASGNGMLEQVWRSLRIEARTLITIIKVDSDLREIAEAHRPVVDALRDGHAARAGRALRKHIESFAAWVPEDEAT
jgi:DNA-binding GntR family transcriptional regulator